MTNDALRTILPVAGWGEERARTVDDYYRGLEIGYLKIDDAG